MQHHVIDLVDLESSAIRRHAFDSSNFLRRGRWHIPLRSIRIHQIRTHVPVGRVHEVSKSMWAGIGIRAGGTIFHRVFGGDKFPGSKKVIANV